MAPIKHGHTLRPIDGNPRSFTPEYRAWVAMKNRCLNPNQARFKDYGGRGITICDRWLGESGFENFLADMGVKPSPKHSLDREKVNLGYDKSNCKWATSTQQARNARSNRIVQINGEAISFAEAVERFGKVAYGTAAMRVNRGGWPEVAAITTPVGGKRP